MYISLSDVSYKRKFKYNFIDIGYLVEKYFKDFVNVFENDGKFFYFELCYLIYIYSFKF